MNNDLLGSCLCGKIHYTIHGGLGPLVYCHCQRCRKASGSPFVSSTEVMRSNFEITAGQSFVKEFSNPGMVNRFFCNNCGSQLYSQRDATPDLMRVRLGTLDSKIDQKVSFHIFTASKAEWHDILDDAPQFEERP